MFPCSRKSRPVTIQKWHILFSTVKSSVMILDSDRTDVRWGSENITDKDLVLAKRITFICKHLEPTSLLWCLSTLNQIRTAIWNRMWHFERSLSSSSPILSTFEFIFSTITSVQGHLKLKFWIDWVRLIKRGSST